MGVGGSQDAGFNAVKSILHGGQSDISDEIADARGTTPLPHFPIAVVVDVLYDPANISDETRADWSLVLVRKTGFSFTP